MLEYLAGAVALSLALGLAIPRSRKATGFFVRFVSHFVALLLEDKIWRRLGLPGPLPRNLGEVLDNPGRLERLLRQSKGLTVDEVVESVEPLAKIMSEPDKQKTAGSIRVRIVNERTRAVRELRLFCKFQTGRGMPFWLQAARAAKEPGVCREVDFYALVRDSVPIKTLRPHLTLKFAALNYVMVALEYVDLEGGEARVVNDSLCATVSEVTAMMVDVAKLHGRFIGADEPETSWIPAKRGLEYLQFIEGFTDKTERVWSLRVFHALKRYFANHPVTLVHGDCRPGNMMFEGADRNHVQSVIFADWEATNVAPLMWDLTYCTTLGWSARDRRAHREGVLCAYLESLAKQIAASQDLVLTLDEARRDVDMLTICLGYLSRTVRVKKLWDNQGNTQKDKLSWFVRMALAMNDLDAKSVSSALGLLESDVRAMQELSMSEVKELFPSLELSKLEEM